MQSVGEVMAIARSFEESLQKALRQVGGSVEGGVAAGGRLSRGLFGEAAVRAKVWTGLRSGAELEEAEYASGVCYLQGAAGRVECGAGGGGHRN